MDFTRNSPFRLMAMDRGINRNILSIRERRGSGDLIIVVNDMVGAGADVLIKHQKYSVHDSPSSVGTTFTFEQAREDGSDKRSRVWVDGPRSALRWPLAIHRLRPTTEVDEAAKVKASDRVFVLPKYSSEVMIMLLSIVVSDIGAKSAKSDNWLRHDVNFTKFKVSIYCQWVFGVSWLSTGQIFSGAFKTVDTESGQSMQEPAQPKTRKEISLYLGEARRLILQYTLDEVVEGALLTFSPQVATKHIDDTIRMWIQTQITDPETLFRRQPRLQDMPKLYPFRLDDPLPEYAARSGLHSLI